LGFGGWQRRGRLEHAADLAIPAQAARDA
jgi:hypothetical protein